jgi:pSer/pThr/pTyr-binding forkhead associated (FHA) protein
MSDLTVTKLESRLERLVEGVFVGLFGRGLGARELVMHLSRALEQGIQSPTDADPRPIAPDHFVIRLNANVYDHLLVRHPALPALLSTHITDLANAGGCRLRAQPVVALVPDSGLNGSAVIVTTAHQNDPQHTTQTLDAAALNAALQRKPGNPVLVIDGDQPVPLTRAIINIGRGRDNDITLSDPFVSRHHAQLRLRLGAYFAFDVNSQSGITVNDVPVREHRLQHGDVLCLGKTRLLYMEDPSAPEIQTDLLTPTDDPG